MNSSNLINMDAFEKRVANIPFEFNNILYKSVPVPVDLLRPFFTVPTPPELQQEDIRLTKFMKTGGFINPIYVRPAWDGNGGFEILKGHRIYHSAIKLRIKELQGAILDLTDQEAIAFLHHCKSSEISFLHEMTN